jgi:DnaJ-class molecular chaperone
MGWKEEGPECRRCHERTETCDHCYGDGRVSNFPVSLECYQCKGTGFTCPNDGADWT